ncbi:ABC transporter permease protein [Streptococcus gordonii]|uniref:ABC transporter permease protein n=1 Tax=Streptococcus gordonii TaxID=1302 RepID=A0A139NEB7_STRGN|nr:ABC transporter permease protein [Streptococcus gordonii]
MTLQFGIWVIQIAVLILVTYANSFVMKNRSKELGIYSILGMEKRHLLTMTFIELCLLYTGVVGLGIICGMLLDKLLYALLLKFMGMPVVLTSTFQWSNIWLTLVSLGLAFAVILFLNSIRLLRYSSLHLMREKKAGEKKGKFLGLQTLLGVILMGVAYYIALTVTRPVAAIANFFLAVLMVVVATYLLFNAGSITLLNFLRKRKSYYYKPQNFISVSNLISRMRKNAAGLATISILSTMLLVTLVGTINIYVGAKDYIDTLYPKDYNVTVSLPDTVDRNEPLLEKVKEIAQESGLKNPTYSDYLYQTSMLSEVAGNEVTVGDRNFMQAPQSFSKAVGSFMLISRQDYEKMTGERLDLADGETLIYGRNLSLDKNQPLRINGKDWKIKQISSQDFTHGHLPNGHIMAGGAMLNMVVNDIKEVGLDVLHEYYIGISSNMKSNQEFSDKVQKAVTEEIDRLQVGGYTVTTNKEEAKQNQKQVTGTLLFIGLFLSVIFLLGAVLVIYYKQISEGYEDRDGFIILQKVGLDEKQTKRTIHKQIVTVFFLPLIFAFCHVAAAFHMLSLIVALLGVTNTPLLIQTTIITCSVFLLAYILVFLLTSRSYRKIVTR